MTDDNTNAQPNDPFAPADTAAAPPVAVSGTDAAPETTDSDTAIVEANAALAATVAAGLPTALPAEAIITTTAGYQPNVPVAVAELTFIANEATYWGGETGVKLRNAALRARTALTGKAE
jgi:hypothetical protein